MFHWIEKGIRYWLLWLDRFRVFRAIFEIVADICTDRTVDVYHGKIHAKFSVPNKLTRFRAETISIKEPETLDWIDSFPSRSILWDVGANVGIYSVYAAKKSHDVVAFEPSFANQHLLAANIDINNISDKVSIITNPLGDEFGVGMMYLSSMRFGAAFATFDSNIGWDGNPIDSKIAYSTLGTTIDKMIQDCGVPKPDYIKIDVDGIEHLILKGAEATLPNVKGLLIEVNDDFVEQANQVYHLLVSYGFSLAKKTHSDMIKLSKDYSNVYNQIWQRKG